MWFCVSLLGTCLVPPELGRLGLRKLILGTCLLRTFQGNASGWLGSCLNLRWPLALSGNAQKSKLEDVMKKRFTLISAVLAFIAWLNLPTLSSADCGSHFSATVTNLPEIDLSGFQVFAINNPGELTGFFYVS